MKNRSVLSVLFVLATIWVLSPVFANRAFAQTSIQIDTTASCTGTCHADFFKKKHIHPAASKGSSCVKCHKPVEPNKHAFKPIPSNKSELCYTCHDEEDPAKKQVHMPVKAGSCTKCHDPHQSDQAKLLKKPSPQLCFGCHDEDEFKGKVVHGPAAEGKCLSCHHPHASENERLLANKTPELCFSCHAAQVKDAQGRMLPATKSLFEDKGASLHPPFATGKCSVCHQPHASASGRLLGKGYPADFYARYTKESYGACFTCHSSKKFEEPRTLTETQFRNGNLNLHHRHVNRDKGRSCGACHSPHGSTQPKLIHPNFQFGEKLLALKYEKSETGGSCTTACHATIRYDRCKPEDIALQTTLRVGSDATQEELKQACEKKK